MTERTSAEREARRTALILAASQAIVGSAAVVAFSLGAIAGQHLLDADKSLATAPITGFNLGVALGAIPAAWIIRRLGQRNGFQVGTLITALGPCPFDHDASLPRPSPLTRRDTRSSTALTSLGSSSV